MNQTYCTDLNFKGWLYFKVRYGKFINKLMNLNVTINKSSHPNMSLLVTCVLLTTKLFSAQWLTTPVLDNNYSIPNTWTFAQCTTIIIKLPTLIENIITGMKIAGLIPKQTNIFFWCLFIENNVYLLLVAEWWLFEKQSNTLYSLFWLTEMRLDHKNEIYL